MLKFIDKNKEKDDILGMAKMAKLKILNVFLSIFLVALVGIIFFFHLPKNQVSFTDVKSDKSKYERDPYLINPILPPNPSITEQKKLIKQFLSHKNFTVE